jgi:muramoyltetrapeptide carboxypeptidase LdcA involved in peptidoglycan recycling
MSHVKLLDLTLDKDEFTFHGLHLNSKGKENVARTTVQHFVDLLNRQEKTVLRLPWIDENKDSNTQLQADDSGTVRSSNLNVKTVRASERSKKPPMRFNDFYG